MKYDFIAKVPEHTEMADVHKRFSEQCRKIHNVFEIAAQKAVGDIPWVIAQELEEFLSHLHNVGLAWSMLYDETDGEIFKPGEEIDNSTYNGMVMYLLDQYATLGKSASYLAGLMNGASRAFDVDE